MLCWHLEEVMALTVTEPRLTRPHDDDEMVEAIYIGGDPAPLAPTGTGALAQPRKRLPDIVFIDLGPADQPLLQTHQTMRQDRDLKDIPAILLWRGSTDSPTIERLGLGAKDFLVK